MYAFARLCAFSFCIPPHLKKDDSMTSFLRHSSIFFLALFLPFFLFAQPSDSSSNFIPLNNLPNWNTDHQSQAIPALLNTCQKPKKNSAATSVSFKTFCYQLQKNPQLSDLQTRALLEKYFVAIPIKNQGNPTGLFTGYYEPMVEGSPVKTAVYSVPIYGKPSGLVKTNINGKSTYRILKNGHYQSIPDRAMLVQNPPQNTPVLAWIHSSIDQFFLQIQGSGLINLTNGQNLLIGYAGENGKNYFPIGAYLVKTNALSSKNISMQSIQDWLEAHPKSAQMVMNLNPSFVFFRALKTNQPIGAEGVELTPYRSLAVDRRFTSLGTPVWLSTSLPQSNTSSTSNTTHNETFDRLLVAQDTGGAIKGPVRGDVYFGSGTEPEWLAGHMQSSGELWALRPKTF